MKQMTEKLVNIDRLDSEVSPEIGLKLENVSVGYKDTTVLNGINFEMPRGATWAIVGPSGAGKTTLFRTILGLLKPKKGAISILGANNRTRQQKQKNRGKVGYIPQNLGLVKSLDVRTNILLGSLGRTGTFASLMGLFLKKDMDYTDELIQNMGLYDKTDKNVQTLSGGEKRRVAISRALLQQPELLIADEFLSELDIVTAANVMDIVMDKQAETGMSLLLIEHNLEMAEKYADRIVVVNNGKVRDIIDPTDLQARTRLRGIFHEN